MRSKFSNYTLVGGGIISLQGLRCYGVLAIFLSHCGTLRIGHLGGLGVSFFILITGYLTAAKYFDSGISSHKGLIIKRLRKYYPLHIITLIASLILSFRAEWTLRRFITLIINASLIQSYVPVSNVYFSFNAVSWYLSLTMFFALVTPLMLRILHVIHERKILIRTAVILFVFQFIWCALSMTAPEKFQHWIVYVSPFVRSIDFLIGGMIFLFMREDRFKSHHRIISFMFLSASMIEIILVILRRNLTGNFIGELFSVSAWTILNVIIIFCVLFNEGRDSFINKIFTNKPAVYIGNVSFEFFMIHGLVKDLTGRIFHKLFGMNESVIVYACAMILTILFAHICNKILQRLMNHEDFMHSRKK